MIHFNRVPEWGRLTGTPEPRSFDEMKDTWNRPRGLFFFLTMSDENRKVGALLRIPGWAFIVSSRPGVLFNKKRKTIFFSRYREDAAALEESLRFEYPEEFK